MLGCVVGVEVVGGGGEAREVSLPAHGDVSHGAVAVLLDDESCSLHPVLLVRVRRAVLVVALAIHEADDVRVLLDVAALAVPADLGAELGQQEAGHPAPTVAQVHHAVRRQHVPSSAGTGPVGPVGPVSPIGPVGPVGPVGPLGPVGPVGPVIPFAPVGPVGPIEPVGPVGPAGPIGPVGPACKPAMSNVVVRTEVPAWTTSTCSVPFRAIAKGKFGICILLEYLGIREDQFAELH